MCPDFKDLLAFEIKKEIADRYFGFRKLIEEDKLDLADKIKQDSFFLQKRISFDLLRIFILLRDEDLILAFLDAAHLDKKNFYDPRFTKVETITARVFQGVPLRGWWKFAKFKNLLYDAYDRLTIHIEQYRGKIKEITELKNTIDMEIKQFYQQNDLGSILHFINALGNTTKVGDMEGGLETGLAADLDHKMHIDPPLPIEHFLPVIEPLPPLRRLRSQLRKWAQPAYKRHGKVFIETYPVHQAYIREHTR